MKIDVLVNKIERKHVLFWALIFVFFLLVVLPIASSVIEELIGYGESPDTMFNGTVSDLYRIHRMYKQEGRQIYIISRLTFDVIWPTVYTMFFFTSMSYLVKKSNNKLSLGLVFVPLVAGMMDSVENWLAIGFMTTNNTMARKFAELLVYATNLKWFLIGFTIFVMLYSLVKVLIIRRK